MHVFMIAAVTVDGFIDRGKHVASTEWTSAEDKQFFKERTKQAGVLVMGSTTFATIGRALPGRKIYVLSSRKKPEEFAEIPESAVEYTHLSPAQLLEILKENGVQEVAVCGGSTVYTQFLRAGLLDTIYLTVEPVVFGEGIQLFNQSLNVSLTLQETKQLSIQTVLYTYQVAAHD